MQHPDSLMVITSVLSREKQPLTGVWDFTLLLWTEGGQRGYTAPSCTYIHTHPRPLIHSDFLYVLAFVSGSLRLYLIPSLHSRFYIKPLTLFPSFPPSFLCPPALM